MSKASWLKAALIARNGEAWYRDYNAKRVERQRAAPKCPKAERLANIQAKAGCIRCLRSLYQPWEEIYPKLHIQKRKALSLVPDCKRGKSVHRRSVLKSEKLLKRNEALRRDRIFKRSVKKYRTAYQAMRTGFGHSMAMLDYYANHDRRKAMAVLVAKRSYAKCRNDPMFRAKRAMRNTVNRIFRGKLKRRKPKATINYLGVSIDEARIFIERQFVRGMSWENHGTVWELDHIVPLAKFDLRDERQVLQASHFTNLRPLWKRDNRRKGVSIHSHVPTRIYVKK